MKNLCSYCGIRSKTDAPFPEKDLTGGWKLIVCPKCYSVEKITLLVHPRSEPTEFTETFISQHKNELRRKLVSNSEIEIVFWFDNNDSITGYQYSFAHEGCMHAFTWHKDMKSKFHKVISQRRHFKINALIENGEFPKKLAEDAFIKGSRNLKPEYRDIVLKGITTHEDN